MAFDAFLKIATIPGESLDDKHKDWIEVLSYSFGVHQPATGAASTTGGAASQRASFSDFTVVHHLDKSAPKLAEACATGEHIKDVTLELCRAGGNKLKYYEIKMEHVIVSAVEAGGHAGGGEDVPTETVSFNYGKIKWTYTQQKRADGSGGGNVPGGWDLTANKKYA